MKKTFCLTLLVFSSLFVSAQSLKKLGLIFDQTTFNFGDVEQWSNQPATFNFTNKGKLSLTILPLFSENDLDVVIPDRPILPGETVQIKAMYYTDGKGPFSRTFPIYFGSRAEPVVLKIVGNIKSLSPEAYIQCPMAKPELSKPRIELVGDVAELDTEIPLSGTTLEFIGLQTNKEVTLFSNSRGGFGAKLPIGNYIVKVNHPNYIPYTGTIYIGQTSPPLRIRLSPIFDEPVFVQNKETKPIENKQKENLEDLNKKDTQVGVYETNKISHYNVEPEKEIIKEKENAKLDRDFEYVKNEPRDDLYTGSQNHEEAKEIPQTLTTYKESNREPAKEEKQAVEKQDNEQIFISEKEKPEQVKPVKVEIPKNNLIFRVLDKNSLDPIESAAVILSDLYNKRNKYSSKTDERGFSELEIEKSDYRFIATADGYISNEIKILEDDKSDVFKIFLSPVSDLYTEIYEAKKDRAKENEELLNKLSFGKTEFTFARDEPEQIATSKTISEPEEMEETFVDQENETEILPKETEEIAQNEEPIIVEKIIYDKAKEDSLQNVIAALEETQKRDTELLNQNLEREKDLAKQRETQKIDSLNKYIADLTAKNKEIKNDLQKVAQDKASLEEAQQRDKEKLDELTAKNNAIKEAEDKDPFSTKKYQANNIIFLIDISTSMEKNNKMAMLKTSIKNLVGILREVDRVAIIAYNQQASIVLESVNGNNKEEILNALDSLKTGGLTNGVKGITTAYEMLNYYFIPSGNNQIILATDGLFSKYNNEMTENELNKLVKKQADANKKLTVVGFGKDETGKILMEKLAKSGTGQYIQISNNYMTRDVLIKEIKLNSEIKVGG